MDTSGKTHRSKLWPRGWSHWEREDSEMKERRQGKEARGKKRDMHVCTRMGWGLGLAWCHAAWEVSPSLVDAERIFFLFWWKKKYLAQDVRYTSSWRHLSNIYTVRQSCYPQNDPWESKRVQGSCQKCRPIWHLSIPLNNTARKLTCTLEISTLDMSLLSGRI